ncbi:MAG: hypothetical protein IJP49_04000 [Bacteroidales bacterium]|nr:hypothetical protein [Bacteroidales bacterium]
MMKTIFESDETEKAFLNWANLWCGNPQESHPLDNEIFYKFALTYYLQKEKVDKEQFVKYAKKKIPTSKLHNRGLTQRYYTHLQIITQFLKDAENRKWISF